MKIEQKDREQLVSDYIRAKHNLDECSGFVDGLNAYENALNKVASSKCATSESKIEDACDNFEMTGSYHYNKYICKNCDKLKHHHKIKIKSNCKVKELPKGLRERAVAQRWNNSTEEETLEKTVFDALDWDGADEGDKFWFDVHTHGIYDGRFEKPTLKQF